MLDQRNIGSIMKDVFISLLISLLMTMILILGMALVLYIGGLGKSAVSVSVVMIYILSILVGGWMAGYKIKHRKFIWGALVGLLYLMIVFSLSLLNGWNNTADTEIHMSISAVFVCIGSGMLGGMFG